MKLIFVYNADSGLVNTLMNIGYKAISPQTYESKLCDLTFGVQDLVLRDLPGLHKRQNHQSWFH